MSGEVTHDREFRKTATIKARQWWQDGDHPRVLILDDGTPWIETLEGGHVVTSGDWIATGVKGEHWPIKPDVFAATYVPVDATRQQPEAGREGEATGFGFSEAVWADAVKETNRLCYELDITNADHIVLWLEHQLDGVKGPLAYIACRILDAHEAATRLAVPAGVGREEVARVLFDQRQSGHDFDDAADADAESDAGTLHSIVHDDADAILSLLSHAEAGGDELLQALEPFRRPTLLHGREEEDRPILMPLYPRHIRGIQQFLGVAPKYTKVGK